MSFADKVLAGQGALVTGSTSGIGLGSARIFAASGAKVMLNGFGKPEEIAAARAEIGALMGVTEAPYSSADMSKPAEIRTMVAQAQAELTLNSVQQKIPELHKERLVQPQVGTELRNLLRQSVLAE
jgi:NAD(P)-dependent dehydrogenase (short-subunit alcohol dehydrogenase family)